MASLKTIEHHESFEVRSDDGHTASQFPFDDNASRRAISGTVKRKQASQAARAFAGKRAVLLPPLELMPWCACRKSNSHIQMMKSAKKWHRKNATNGVYCSRQWRFLFD